jgi:hypothetical protein
MRSPAEEKLMNFETIVITAVFGSLAGWLTGVVTKRAGYELLEATALGRGWCCGRLALWMQGINARRQPARDVWCCVCRSFHSNVETAATQ